MSQQEEPTADSPPLINPGVLIVYTGNNVNERGPQWETPEQVLCPACDDNHVHIGMPQGVDGQDNYKAWKGRGDLVVVPMFCERGRHEWDFCFGFHKGATYSFIRNLTIRTETELDTDLDELGSHDEQEL